MRESAKQAGHRSTRAEFLTEQPKRGAWAMPPAPPRAPCTASCLVEVGSRAEGAPQHPRGKHVPQHLAEGGAHHLHGAP